MKICSEGMFGSNVYILTNENKESLIIDAGVDYSLIKKYVDNDVNVKYIILTHAHVDHIYCINSYSELFDAKVYLHEKEIEIALDAKYNFSNVTGEEVTLKSNYESLKDGQILEFGRSKIEIIHTPGHTPGGICIKVDNRLFTGDTLFNMSIGRTDLYKGDLDILISSIKDKLLILEESIEIYPGHGTKSTIEKEKKENMYLR